MAMAMVAMLAMAPAALLIAAPAVAAAEAFAPPPILLTRASTSGSGDPRRNRVPGPAAVPEAEEATVPAITERILSLTEDPRAAIVVDVENLRGKTGFELDHADLLDRLLVWTSLRNCAAGRTLAVVDHGREASAHLLSGEAAGEEAALCVAFAGPSAKADDVIARDVRWLTSSPDPLADRVVVITADQELAWRCRCAVLTGKEGVSGTKLNSIVRSFADDDFSAPRVKRKGSKQRKKGGKKSRAARKRETLLRQQQEEGHSEEVQTSDGIIAEDTNATTDEASCNVEKLHRKDAAPTVEIIAPQRFLEDLEQAQLEWLEECADEGSPRPAPVATAQDLLRIRGQILSLESLLRRGCSLRKRHTLTGELRQRKEEWGEVLASADAEDGGTLSAISPLARSLSSHEGEGNSFSELEFSSSSNSWERLTSQEREKLLVRWGRQDKRRRGARKREMTEDRIILAERLRMQLDLILDSNCEAEESDDVGEPSLVHSYARYTNSMIREEQG